MGWAVCRGRCFAVWVTGTPGDRVRADRREHRVVIWTRGLGFAQSTVSAASVLSPDTRLWFGESGQCYSPRSCSLRTWPAVLGDVSYPTGRGTPTSAKAPIVVAGRVDAVSDQVTAHGRQRLPPARARSSSSGDTQWVCRTVRDPVPSCSAERAETGHRRGDHALLGQRLDRRFAQAGELRRRQRRQRDEHA